MVPASPAPLQSRRSFGMGIAVGMLVALIAGAAGAGVVKLTARVPPNLLDETQKLPPGARWEGLVTFDGRVDSFVPDSLSYIDGKQTLVQVFKGKPGVVPGG